MFETATQYLNITSSLITVASIVFVIQLIFKWTNSPRFSVGVLPDKKEQEDEGIKTLGSSSHFDEFIFDKKFLSVDLKEETELKSLKFDNDSSRSVYRDLKGHLLLPIIIQNEGKSEAAHYKMTVTFTHPQIRIAQVKCESLEVDCLYTQDDSRIQDSSLAEKIPAQEIRDMYKDLNLLNDYLCLRGSLESRTFEAVFLEVFVPNDCRDFFILFKIDCPDFFHYQRQVTGQFINVFQNKNRD